MAVCRAQSSVETGKLLRTTPRTATAKTTTLRS